ncbi:hypothetical protein OV450_1438 [Actinobacteria bacterium OV450]|nr:hypothetical protein OV450_1438 [Actinobacteria bacterium OV450]
MPCPDPNVILQALATGVTGDTVTGLAILQPIVDDGPAEAFAMLCSLAETASKRARDAAPPGAVFGIEVDGPAGLGTASVDVLPPSLRFGAQFISAWANRDMEMAYALFWAVAESVNDDGTHALPESVGAVYWLAVASAREIVAEVRAARQASGLDR